MVTQVVRDRTRNAYLLLRDNQELGYAEYRIDGDIITFTHTVIDQRLQGQGLGSVLARFALGEIQDTTHLRVVPQCPFIAEWIHRHPEFQPLLAQPEN